MSSSFVRPWTVAHQTHLYTGFPRQEYWNGLPFPSPDDLNPGIELQSPAWQAESLPLSHLGSPHLQTYSICVIWVLLSPTDAQIEKGIHKYKKYPWFYIYTEDYYVLMEKCYISQNSKMKIKMKIIFFNKNCQIIRAHWRKIFRLREKITFVDLLHLSVETSYISLFSKHIYWTR